MSDLFRSQALQFRIGRSQGQPRIIRPPGAWALIALLLGFITAAVMFLATNDYARKATVPGMVELDGGVNRVHAPRAGILEDYRVAEGEAVRAGEKIARFRVPPAVDTTDHATLLHEYRSQLAGLAGRTASLVEEQARETARLTEEHDRLSREIDHYRRITRLQADKIGHLASSREAAAPLYETGQLSRLEWARFNEALLNGQQYLEQLSADQASRHAQVRANELAMAQVPGTFGARLDAVARERSRIRQEVARLESREAFDIIAPVGGILARRFVRPGQRIDPEGVVVTIQPEGAALRARLMIPSRAAGFVGTGQSVNLLYDAFPYQQFGTYGGQVEKVSSHALLPGDGPMGSREPVFEAIVRLDEGWVDAYGSRVALRDGMTLRADIILERRSLIDWLLEPLYVMRGRSQ